MDEKQISDTSVPVAVGQVVYMMPVQQGVPSQFRPVPRVKCLSISIVVIGVLTILLGIIDVILRGHLAYVGSPIWSGLLVRSIIYRKPGQTCPYLVNLTSM